VASTKQKREKGYDPKQIRLIWNYFFNFLDKLFKDCKVTLTKKPKGYDLEEHTITMKPSTAFTKVELIASYIKMFLYNLAPGIKKVKYKDMDYLMVSLKDIDLMAGRIAEDMTYYNKERFTGNWIEHVEKKYTVKKPKSNSKTDMISKEDLCYMYYDKRLTMKQIAAILKVTERTVTNLFRKHGITGRMPTIYISPKKLDDLYYNQDFSVEEIAKIFDVTRQTIMKKMDEYGMERRKSAYTIPAFMNRMRVFKSQLRKQFRLNPIYAKGAREVLAHFDRDPDLKPETEKVEKENNRL
jgi:predicted DNA-binding protein YlxM (UPF0122 family)